MNCLYCNKPVTQSFGKDIYKRDITGNMVYAYTNTNQEVFFHGDCRKLGRKDMRRNKRTIPSLAMRMFHKITNKFIKEDK